MSKILTDGNEGSNRSTSANHCKRAVLQSRASGIQKAFLSHRAWYGKTMERIEGEPREILEKS